MAVIHARKNSSQDDSRLTVYACQPDEAPLFQRYAEQYGLELSLYDQPVSAENAVFAAGSQCISVSHRAPVTASILEQLHDVGVRYISTRSVGYDHIDIDYAKKLGITVGNIYYSPDSVADYTLMLILMAARRVKTVLQHTEMQNDSLQGVCGRAMSSLTVGVAGTGHIGRAVIDRLRSFGCQIIAYDVYPRADILPYLSYVDRDTLLTRSDILTLHMPATVATYHWIDRQSLARMKSGAVLINTARGSLVDSFALVDALERGHLSGAALDVIEEEGGLCHQFPDNSVPQSAAALLNVSPNVILTPHTAYYTDHSVKQMVENSIKKCLLYQKQSNACIASSKKCL